VSDDELRFDEDGFLNLESYSDETDGDVGADVDDALASDRSELDDGYDDTWLTGPLDAALDPDATYTTELDDGGWLPSTNDEEQEAAVDGPFDLTDYADVLTGDGDGTDGTDVADDDRGGDLDDEVTTIGDGGDDTSPFGSLVADDGPDAGDADELFAFDEPTWEDPVDLSTTFDGGTDETFDGTGDDSDVDLSDLDF